MYQRGLLAGLGLLLLGRRLLGLGLGLNRLLLALLLLGGGGFFCACAEAWLDAAALLGELACNRVKIAARTAWDYLAACKALAS